MQKQPFVAKDGAEMDENQLREMWRGKKVKENKIEKRLEAHRQGTRMKGQHEYLPEFEERQCHDVCCIALFAFVVVATAVMAFLYSSVIVEKDVARDDLDEMTYSTVEKRGTNNEINLMTMTIVGTAGSFAGLLTGCGFIALCILMPKKVVWCSLLMGPVMMVICGLVLMATGHIFAIIMGAILSVLGVLFFFCALVCYRSLIPHMVMLTVMVSKVIATNKCMIAVSIVGAMKGIAWTVCCALAFGGAAKHHQAALESQSSYVKYTMIFVVGTVYLWGIGVVTNTCHVIYCGVFSRWVRETARKEIQGGTEQGCHLVCPSIWVACTKAFGSVCMGSLTVALVRAAELMVRMMANDAAEDGNMVLCIALACVECVISCIGDILEYFNEWAYVQCAIRDVAFIDAVRITWTLCTSRNFGSVLNDLLLDTVVSCGILLCAAMGGIVGFLSGLLIHSMLVGAYGAMLGFFGGLVAGSAMLSIYNSGIKTLMIVCIECPQDFQAALPGQYKWLENWMNGAHDSEFRRREDSDTSD